MIPAGAPIAGESLFRLLVCVPVTERRRVAFDLQCSHLTGCDFVAVRIDNSRLVTIDDAAKTSGLDVAGPVRDVDVKHLCGADAVADVDAECIHPTLIEFFRQSFTGGITETKTRKIAG